MSKANMEAKNRGRPRKMAMPAGIRKAYLNIKKIYENATVSRYAGKYRAYVTVQANNKKGKKESLTVYIGWIKNGKLVPPKKKSTAEKVKEAKRYYEDAFAALASKNSYLEKRAAQAEKAGKSSMDLSNRILTYLSMNCRATAKEIAKSLNEKPAAALCQMREIERKYGLQYTIEMNIPLLGYLCFIALGKFTGGMPDRDMLARKLVGNSKIQLAFLMLGGEADIAIYYLAERKYENENGSIEDCYDEFLESVLPGFNIKWTLSQFFFIDGQLPIRERFFALLKNGKALGATGSRQDAKDAKVLTYKKFAVLKELFLNARQPLSNINRKYGFEANAAYNALGKLLNGKVILRNTISIGKAPVKYYAFIEATPISMEAYEASREKWLKHIIEKTAYPVNRYALIGEINAPHWELVHVAPVIDKEGLESIKSNMQKLGMHIHESIITDVLVGHIPLRRFDEEHSQAQKTLIEEFWRTNSKIKRKNYCIK